MLPSSDPRRERCEAAPRVPPAFALLFFLASCDVVEPSDSARCGSFGACGGDIAGTWGIEASCASAGAAEDCPQSLLRYSSYNRTGTYEFAASGELVMTQRTRYALHSTLPRSCLSGASCATYESLLESEPGGVGETLDVDATCSDGGTSCTCDVTAAITEMFTGTYDIEGSTLTLSNGAEYDYCVEGDELSLKSGALEMFLVKF
jgi:hypothetical protein